MTKIIEAAGLEPWPNLFQTLRRSCETQMAMTVPQHAVSAWIGHSELVSARHYLQVTDELFQRITGNTEGTTHGLRAAESAAESAAVKPGIGSQDGESDSAGERAAGEEATKKPGNCRVFPIVASNCEVVRAGIEPATHGFSVPEKTSIHSGKTPKTGKGTAHLQRAEKTESEIAIPENNCLSVSLNGTSLPPLSRLILDYVAQRLEAIESNVCEG